MNIEVKNCRHVICRYVISVLVFVLVFMNAQVSFGESEIAEENEFDSSLNSEIKILVDDEKIEPLDQKPYINEDGRIQVPVRFVTKVLGGEVTWKEDEQRVIIEKDGNNLSLEIGSNIYTFNGEEKEMDTAPKILGENRTVVPLRFISEELGEEVDWDENERRVYIYSTVDAAEDEKENQNSEELSEKISEKNAIITASALNVRSDPGIDNHDFGRVYNGEAYQILDKHIIEKEDVDYKEWLLIELSEANSVEKDERDNNEEDNLKDDNADEMTEGWISLDYVEIVDSDEGLVMAEDQVSFSEVNTDTAMNVDKNVRDLKGDGDLIWPVDSSAGYVSSPYGPRGRGFHTGVDYSAPRGTTIWAADDGVVEFSGQRANYGKLIIIDHYNGLKTYYAHNYSNDVSEGEIVEKGQTIGRIGRTGNATGSHLHFEVHVDGNYVNPLDYVRP